MSDYKKQLKARRFKYDDDKDALKRGLGDMVTLLQWQFYCLLAIAIIVGTCFLSAAFYYLMNGGF